MEAAAEEENSPNSNTDDDAQPMLSLSVVNAITGDEVVFLKDVDPATTTVADVKAKIHEQQPDIAVSHMQLFYRGTGGGGGGDNPDLALEDDARPLTSYGIVGSEDGDDIATLQLLVVAPLPPEEVEARSREVWEAAKKGDEARLAAAIEKGGADLNWRNPERAGFVSGATYEGWTACYAATKTGSEACLALLIQAGADVDLANNWGMTPCRVAASHGAEACLAQLIQAGADVNRADNNGQSPCYGAARWGEAACLAQLIQAGADVNRADNEGITPLAIATRYNMFCKTGRDACVALLKEAGAKVMVGGNGRTRRKKRSKLRKKRPKLRKKRHKSRKKRRKSRKKRRKSRKKRRHRRNARQ